MSTAKTLDIKLAKIKADPSCREFIIADAKDADMAFGIAAPGKSPEHHAKEGSFRSLPEYRECIRQVVRQGVVDIMLMSAHTNDILTIGEGLFENSHVTPAARANDTTDIHVARGSVYTGHPAQPFRTATIDHIQCGHVDCATEERARGANLGLYSVTFNNDTERDHLTLEHYKAFRIEAERKGFRHFLEVFDPNAPVNPVAPDKLGGFINDMIVRSLAGVPEAGRPLFLKMVYHGPKWTEELAGYDPHLVVGILGGSAGTTYDAFKLIAEAQKYGAKVALFGRKINNAEHQLAFVEMLRRIVDGEVSPEDAVRAYHGILQGLGIRPHRSLDEDMQLQTGVMSYGGSGTSVSVPAPAAVPAASTPGTASGNGSKPVVQATGHMTRAARSAAVSYPRNGDGSPDFVKMTPAERLAYYRSRLSQL
ncbi:MAG: hypothetical protein JXA69_03320 [Phycisphaerae bacterium]|nr:hypothetical protein [Phycisphaerae bacterium]